MTELKISNDISLPIDAATQTIAIVARKRVGKTYTASVIVEEFIHQGIPVVVLDPTGAWWGLRSSADGKKDGFPVVIIGGDHADVPLDEHAGKVIADLVVDHPGYYIIDFSLIGSNAAQDRFATDFGLHFYRRKQGSRYAVSLIIDEADCFMPQQPFENQKKMLGAYDTIIRRGGISGIGVIMITQRPAVLNKNALTQAETLIALQLSGSQDIDAIEHWMRIHGSKEERDTVISSLAYLQKGDAWIWSPAWLKVLRKVKIRQRTTFNSSATPEVGQNVVVKPKLAAVDLKRLGQQIESTVEKLKENDPALLKQTISELKKKITALENQKPTPAKEKIVEVPALGKRQEKQLLELVEVAQKINSANERIISILDHGKTFSTHAISVADAIRESLKPSLKGSINLGLKIIHKPIDVIAPKAFPKNPAKQDASMNEDWIFKPDKCQRAILGVLSQFQEGCSMNKIALLARYSISGGFRNSLGLLRAQGCIMGSNNETMLITESGRKFAAGFQQLPQGDDLIDYWKQHNAFSLCHRQIITVLADHRGVEGGLTMEEIASQCSPPYEISGGFRNALGELRTAGVITGKNTDRMKLNSEMF